MQEGGRNKPANEQMRLMRQDARHSAVGSVWEEKPPAARSANPSMAAINPGPASDRINCRGGEGQERRDRSTQPCHAALQRAADDLLLLPRDTRPTPILPGAK